MAGILRFVGTIQLHIMIVLAKLSNFSLLRSDKIAVNDKTLLHKTCKITTYDAFEILGKLFYFIYYT